MHNSVRFRRSWVLKVSSSLATFFLLGTSFLQTAVPVAAQPYTVTYDANGATSGTPPTDSNNYIVDATVTVLDNTGNLAKIGYSFSGWNTVAGGGGTPYAAGATFAMPAADVTLYAQWSALPDRTVTFNANGGSGTMANQITNVPTALTANAFTRIGYSFSGWNTVAGGSGTAYANGASYPFDADVTLYAQWSALPDRTVTYDGNGSTSGAPPTDANNYIVGATVTVLGNTGALARTGYTFNNWNTAADGSGTSYAAAATFTMPAASVILYAQWTVNQYIVTFDSQGGSAVAPQTVAHGLKAIAPADPTRTGYTFDGWFKEAAGTNAWTFTTDTVTAATTLYGKWTAISTGGGGGGGFGSQLVGIGLSGTSPFMDGNGKAVTAGDIHTEDNKVSLQIPVGTAVWNAAGAAQSFLSAAILTNPPSAPAQHTLFMAYELGPAGVTFNPGIKLIFTFTENQISNEPDMYIAWWNGNEWIKLESIVNTVSNTVSSTINHFTNFALIAPPAPPPPTPVLKVNSPATGAEFELNSITLNISVDNLKLVPAGRANTPGEGRIVYYLDVSIPTVSGKSALTSPGTYKESQSTTNTWADLAYGPHTLGVQLIQNDGTPFNPPIYATINGIIKEPTPSATAVIPNQDQTPIIPPNDLTKPNWIIPILVLVISSGLGIFLYWRSRKPTEKLNYTNR